MSVARRARSPASSAIHDSPWAARETSEPPARSVSADGGGEVGHAAGDLEHGRRPRCAFRSAAQRSSSSSVVWTPSRPASFIRSAATSAWSPADAPPKRASRRPEPCCQAASSESASSGSAGELRGGGREHVGVVARAERGGGGGRLGVQPHGDVEDQPERPVGAGEELAEVVARDVLDHLRARLRDRAVGERERDAEHEVAHAAVAVAQRAGVGGRHEAADRRRVARAQRRVEREHLARLAEPRLRLGQRHAGLQHRGQVALVVLEDLRHPAGLELDRDRLADAAPVELRPPAHAAARRARPRRASAAAPRPPPASRAAPSSPPPWPLRTSRRARRLPAGGPGTGPGPRRTAAASASPWSGWRAPRDRTRSAGAGTRPGRARRTSSACASSCRPRRRARR